MMRNAKDKKLSVFDRGMVAIGLPIKSSKNRYYFDTNKVLSRNELDDIIKCIEESTLNKNDKLRLIQKVNNNFTIEKY